MKCSKCKREIPENTTICPYCHKVLALECPNCHSIGENPICEKCGFIILTKCSKCGRTISTAADKCKCGFPVKTSIAYQECESDEFASVIVRFAALKQIRKILGSQELFSKFYLRLRNLLIAQLSGIDGKIIIYNDIFTFYDLLHLSYDLLLLNSGLLRYRHEYFRRPHYLHQWYDHYCYLGMMKVKNFC